MLRWTALAVLAFVVPGMAYGIDTDVGGTGAPAAVDYTADNGTVWINVAVDYEYGGDWGVRDPPMHGSLVVFDTATNDTTNRFEAGAGEPVSVWLWWHDVDSSNTDLDLLVSNGTHHHTGVTDRRGGGPVLPFESVAFVPQNDGGWEISVGVVGAAFPDRIQLFVGGINNSLEHHAGKSAYGSSLGAVPDHTVVELVITTHNPVCTAGFLHHINVTRLTDVRPLYRDGVRGYSADQYENGINVTAIIWPRDAAEVMRAVAERTEVRSVAAYPYGAQNATGQSPPLALAANPDVETPEFYGGATRCDVIFDSDLLQMFMDEVVGWNGAPDPVPRYAEIADEVMESTPINLTLDPRPADQQDPISKIYHYGDLVRVGVWTYNVTDAWAHLQKNGALVIYAIDNGESLGKVGAYIPISLMWSLHERDGVWLVEVIQGRYLE